MYIESVIDYFFFLRFGGEMQEKERKDRKITNNKKYCSLLIQVFINNSVIINSASSKNLNKKKAF